jgi:hybrid cluster-associated redox disulfide protein
MEQPNVQANLIVADVLARWPQTIPVFIRHRMGCIDCPFSLFETLAEVAAVYDLDLSQFLGELEQSISPASPEL